MSKVVVIGGGASGMMAAVTAAMKGASVILLEANEKLGKKLYITGKGRCNVTNRCDRDTFLKNVVKNPRFLYSALEAFSPEDMILWLEDHGCPTVTERGNRVFPASQKASDVTRTFEKQLIRFGVRVCLHTRVSGLHIIHGQVHGVCCANGEIVPADAVVLATGGKSYPSTGSTGDGFCWLEECGHTVFPALPSLVGMISEEQWVRDLQGLTLKNVKMMVKQEKKKLYSEIGEVTFTNNGISGPLSLTASAIITEKDPETVRVTLDLKPGLTLEQLDARILRDIASSPKNTIGALLYGLFPAKLAETMGSLCKLDLFSLGCTMTAQARKTLTGKTKELQIPVKRLASLDEAIVTRGGVQVKEIIPSTMESRLIRGLYVCGELLDVDALTGGFNLQIAFSTGYLAGISAASCSEAE